MRYLKFAIATVFILAGCKALPPPKEPMSAGPKPTPEQTERAIRDFLAATLKDPESLKQFAIYYGPYLKEHQDTKWSPWKAGWVVCFRYNAKNSYGGYVGAQTSAVYLMGHETQPYVLEVIPEILVPTYCPAR